MKRLFSMWSLFVLVGVLLLLSCVAFAADPAAAVVPAGGSTAPQALSAFLKDTLFPIVGSMFLGILSVFLNRFGAKYKIDALTQKDNFLTQLAYQGVTMAEEKAAQLVGSKASLSGSEKLDLAVSHILSVMPTVSPERARAITEATLAQIPGVGATGDKAFSFGTILSAATAALPAEPVISAPEPSPAA